MIIEKQAYQCDKCGQAWLSGREANNHHCSHDKHCDDCGVLLDPKCYYTVCMECRAKREEIREANRFEKATKMTVEEYEKAYPGRLYSDGDELFEGEADSLADVILDRTGKYPTYVWGTEKIPIELDAESIVRMLTENDNAYEDYEISDDAFKDIHEFVERFNKKHGSYSIVASDDVAILLDNEAQEGGIE